MSTDAASVWLRAEVIFVAEVEEVCRAEADDIAATDFTTTACRLELTGLGAEGREDEDANEESLSACVAAEELVVEATGAVLTIGDGAVFEGGGVVEQDTRSGNITQMYPANDSGNLLITNLLTIVETFQ